MARKRKKKKNFKKRIVCFNCGHGELSVDSQEVVYSTHWASLKGNKLILKDRERSDEQICEFMVSCSMCNLTEIFITYSDTEQFILNGLRGKQGSFNSQSPKIKQEAKKLRRRREVKNAES